MPRPVGRCRTARSEVIDQLDIGDALVGFPERGASPEVLQDQIKILVQRHSEQSTVYSYPKLPRPESKIGQERWKANQLAMQFCEPVGGQQMLSETGRLAN